MGLTRQAAEPPLSPSSMLYVLYVLYYSVRALKYTTCATQCIFGTCWRCYVYSIQASIPYSTYSTCSKELGESGGSAGCLVRAILPHLVHIAWTWNSGGSAGWGPYSTCSTYSMGEWRFSGLGVILQRVAQLCVFGQGCKCARLPATWQQGQRPARSLRNAFGRASAWSAPAVSRITGRCTTPSNSPPWRSPCRTRTFASRAQSP